MKKIFTISVLFLLISIFIPKDALAQACRGTVVDKDANPVSGVTVTIEVCVVAGCDTVTQTTDSGGQWQTATPEFLGNIQSVTFTAPNFDTKIIQQRGIGGCSSCTEASCQWQGDNPTYVTLQSGGGQPLGWDCINPTGTTPDTKCNQVAGGQFTTQEECFQSPQCTVTLTPTSIPGKGSGPLKDCPGGKGIDTAIGCIPIESTDSFIGFILRWAIGVGGGIAFLLIVFAGFQIMTSAGNPERLQAGRELLTSAIAGLILLIFSVFILRVIGVDILGLPGFGE